MKFPMKSDEHRDLFRSPNQRNRPLRFLSAALREISFAKKFAASPCPSRLRRPDSTRDYRDEKPCPSDEDRTSVRLKKYSSGPERAPNSGFNSRDSGSVRAITCNPNSPRMPGSLPSARRSASASEASLQLSVRSAGCRRAEVPARVPATLSVPEFCRCTVARDGCAASAMRQRPALSCSMEPERSSSAKGRRSIPRLKLIRPKSISMRESCAAARGRFLSRNILSRAQIRWRWKPAFHIPAAVIVAHKIQTWMRQFQGAEF